MKLINLAELNISIGYKYDIIKNHLKKTAILHSWVLYLPGIVFAFLSSVIRFKAFQQTSFANGWDGYFYLIQLKSWIEEGTMHSSDISFIYPILRFAHFFTSDYILTYKLVAALLAGIVTFSMFHLTKRWSGNVYLAILVGALSLFSPHLTYFAAQYPKNTLGLFFLLSFIASLESKSKYSPFLWLLLGFFGHRLTFGLSLIFGISWITFKHFSIKKITLFIGAVLILLGSSYLIPGMPNISDFQRFDGLLSLNIQFAPYSFFNTFGQNDRISAFWMSEIILATVLYFLSIPFLLLKEQRWLRLTLFGISSLLLFPFFEWNLTGMAYRFFLVYILLAPLFLPLFLNIKNKKSTKVTLLFITILLMLGSIFSWRSYKPKKHDADYTKYAQLTVNTQKYLTKKNTDLVIIHNAFAEYFTFTTGIDAMPWNPEYKIPSDRLWRIATDIRLSEMAYYLSEKELDQVKKIGVRYFLLPEYLWQKILQKAMESGDDFLIKKLDTWRNPHRIRPGFLLKKK